MVGKVQSWARRCPTRYHGGVSLDPACRRKHGQWLTLSQAHQRGSAGLSSLGELLQAVLPAITQQGRRQEFVGGQFGSVALDQGWFPPREHGSANVPKYSGQGCKIETIPNGTRGTARSRLISVELNRKWTWEVGHGAFRSPCDLRRPGFADGKIYRSGKAI